jgi:hypothetical protein
MSSPSTQLNGLTRRVRSVTVSFSDTIELPKKKVEWTPNGVSLVTKWGFAEGTEVEFAFEHGGTRHCCIGIVVACRPLARPANHFSTVLYFIEVPCDELRHAACDCQLAHPKHRPCKEADSR